MANKVKLNLAGFRALRTDPAVSRFIQDIAEDIAHDADAEAFEDEPRNRARSAVVGSRRDADKMMRALGAQMGRH